MRREFRRFFILLCTFILLLIARFGNWQVHAAGVGQLLQNAGADDDILAELDLLLAWASLVPIALLGVAFIGVFALFLAPIFHSSKTSDASAGPGLIDSGHAADSRENREIRAEGLPFS